jgi:hypothetical protein
MSRLPARAAAILRQFENDCRTATIAEMDDYQFRAIRGLLLVAVILLGFIAGLLLAFAWEYL